MWRPDTDTEMIKFSIYGIVKEFKRVSEPLLKKVEITLLEDPKRDTSIF